MNKIDPSEVNKRADLLALASSATTLKRWASTEGGELAGPCPMCGGTDRFHVQPNRQPFGLWMCHKCTDSVWKDPIELGRRLWPALKFPEICERLAGGNLPTTSEPRKVELKPAAAPPPDDWQHAARRVVEEAQSALWQPKYKTVLDYLHGRGLTDDTIKRYQLGYNPQGYKVDGEYWLDQGIVIPCVVREVVWYMKIRRHKGADSKYRCMTGSKPAALFNAETLTSGGPALFVEGEFDCMLAWQEFGDLVPTVTLGSADNRPDLATWGKYLIRPNVSMLCYDNDEAGEKGAAIITEMTRNPVLALLPEGVKDLTDYHQAGGKLAPWITEYLAQYTEDYPLISAALDLGGVLVA